MVKNGGSRKDPTIDLRLRTHHAECLHIIARRDEISVSKAFANILEKHADLTDPSISEPAHKSRLHLWASLTHIAILDRLSVKWGLTRSDVARRLIDRELASGR